MRVALVNPPWSFEGSIYFGCREPHLPLELGYADALLRRAGHETMLLDCHLNVAETETACQAIENFGADMTVVTIAPTYLFWRCAQPELRVPAYFFRLLGRRRRPDGGGRAARIGHSRNSVAKAGRGRCCAGRMRAGYRGDGRHPGLVPRPLGCRSQR
jgi:hypothetical protein